jgi:serine protease AprX
MLPRPVALALVWPLASLGGPTAQSAPDEPTSLVILAVESGAARSVAEQIRQMGRGATAFPDLDAVAAEAGNVPLSWLEIPGVLHLRPNPAMRPLLDRTVPYVGAPVVWETYGERGQNVSVLVLDTGIDGTHPDVRLGQNLVQNVVPTRTPSALPVGYVEDQPSTDVGGHGTHVAGIVGASGLGSENRYLGAAPGVRIVGFSAGVTDPATSETSLDGAGILSGFQYAIDHRDRYNLRVVSNSWGSSGAFDADDPITRATLALYRAGIVVVFAAGNEGRNGEGTLNPYSVAPWVLSVGAGDLRGRLTNFSSVGTNATVSGIAYDHPDLVAPGLQVVAPKASSDTGRSFFAPGSSEAGLYTAKSGTSMATPHVAGAAALLLSHNPSLSPDDVYDLLVATARPMEEPLWYVGRGYLDAHEAFNASLRVQGTLPTFLSGQMRYAGPSSGDPAFAKDSTSEAQVPAAGPAPSPVTSPTPESTATSENNATASLETSSPGSTPAAPAWAAVALALALVVIPRSHQGRPGSRLK